MARKAQARALARAAKFAVTTALALAFSAGPAQAQALLPEVPDLGVDIADTAERRAVNEIVRPTAASTSPVRSRP